MTVHTVSSIPAFRGALLSAGEKLVRVLAGGGVEGEGNGGSGGARMWARCWRGCELGGEECCFDVWGASWVLVDLWGCGGGSFRIQSAVGGVGSGGDGVLAGWNPPV